MDLLRSVCLGVCGGQRVDGLSSRAPRTNNPDSTYIIDNHLILLSAVAIDIYTPIDVHIKIPIKITCIILFFIRLNAVVEKVIIKLI